MIYRVYIYTIVRKRLLQRHPHDFLEQKLINMMVFKQLISYCHGLASRSNRVLYTKGRGMSSANFDVLHVQVLEF